MIRRLNRRDSEGGGKKKKQKRFTNERNIPSDVITIKV